MTIAHRRWLLISFFLVFILVSPLIIVYASGYRYNTRLRRIEQVGLLSLSVQQSGIDIHLDDDVRSIKGNAFTATLPPRDYTIRVTKPGYHVWQKTLPIYEGQTTFSHDIRLFAEAEPQPVELFTNPLMRLARTAEAELFASDAAMVVYSSDRATITETEWPVAQSVPTSVQLWEDKIAIFSQEKTWYRAELGSSAISIEPLILPNGTTKAFLFKDVILAISADRVWEWRDGTVTPLFAIPDIQSITLANDTYFVLAAEATKKRSFLYEVSDATARPVFITSLPYSAQWTITEPHGTLLVAVDEQQAQLQLIDTRVSPAEVVALDGVFDWHWSEDDRALLTATANELAIYHLDNGITQELLLRQSEAISDVAWVPGLDWVLFTSGNTLFALERDGRDRRNLYALAQNKNHPHILKVTDDLVQFSSQEQSSFVIWEVPLIAD